MEEGRTSKSQMWRSLIALAGGLLLLVAIGMLMVWVGTLIAAD